MDLYSGTPYWLIKNPLDNYYNPLSDDISTEVAVIGSGITGALVSNELCRYGIDCVVVDKRSVSTGSSVASTALLQYEIDVPLYRLIEKVGEDAAVEAYRWCLRSIDDLEQVFARAGVDASFQRVPNLFYASSSRDTEIIEREYETRRKYGLPVRLMDRNEIFRTYGINKPLGLGNDVSAQIDAYRAATGLLRHNIMHNRLRLYTHTEISACHHDSGGYQLRTPEGRTITARHVVVAAGFEAGPFMPGKLMDLTTTFAIISEPVAPSRLWPGNALIWETAQPYLYIRTDGRNRIIVGGEDERYNNATARRFVIDKKSRILERKFRKLMPSVPFKTEMAWCGTFSSTADGLPIIGPAEGNEGMMYALGYGGNGITFSMIAAQIIAARLRGRPDPRQWIFSPGRASLH